MFGVVKGKKYLCNPKTEDSLAQLVEHNTFNVGVSGSSPERVTRVNELSFDNIASLAQLVEHLTLNQGV